MSNKRNKQWRQTPRVQLGEPLPVAERALPYDAATEARRAEMAEQVVPASEPTTTEAIRMMRDDMETGATTIGGDGPLTVELAEVEGESESFNRAASAAEDPMPQPAPVTASEAAISAEFREFMAQKSAALQAKIERARLEVEAPAVKPFRCLGCGNVDGFPAYCVSCRMREKLNANPRVETALRSCPPGVPMIAWHAAVGALLERRPQRCNAAQVIHHIDHNFATVRAVMLAAFAALAKIPMDQENP